MNGNARLPVIPQNVTVHLGPPVSSAQNVTVPFAHYIKNVASSEIYPTWSESAIRANVLAQISFALNRIYTEYYRSRGYDFDITNSTAIDQAFVYGRDIFDNISKIVDETLGDYLVREGAVEPLFALYCNGTTVTCDGLSQWGSEAQGKAGRTAYEILTSYYGDDVRIVEDAPVGNVEESYPGVPLREGSSGNEVAMIQLRLNRIGRNYPAIPVIREANGFFGRETAEAVRAFQNIFSLTADGIVGRATWYRIQQIYSGVKSLSDLASEGVPIEDVTNIFDGELSEGDSGEGVSELQYLLSFISKFVPYVPTVQVDGIFGSATEQAVRAFQVYYGLEENGVVTTPVWEKLVAVYRGFLESLPPRYFSTFDIYLGSPLTLGDENIYVERVQTYLSYISDFDSSIPKVETDGIYGPATAEAVRAFQASQGLEPTGSVGAVTFSRLAEEYRRLLPQGMTEEESFEQ